jgi:hypothetical protein
VVGDYQIPAYLINVEENVEIALPDLRFRPRRIVSTVLLSEDVPNYPFFLVNLEDRERELSFEFNKELFLLEPDLGGILWGAGEVAEFNLSIVQGVDKEIDEIFLARSLGDDFSLEFPISINFTSKIEDVGTPYLEGDERENLGSYCSELGGVPCTGGEVCSVDEVNSLDGDCCVGSCQKPGRGGGSTAYIGWLF